jgi:hypothetical protein
MNTANVVMQAFWIGGVMDTPKKQDGWGAIADYIITMEQNDVWQHDTETVTALGKKPSFNKWGNKKTVEIGISTFVFWQYRRAGLLYNELLDFPALNLVHPLKDIPPDIKAESLNELDKLRRVMPEQEFIDLCKNVLSGDFRSRKKLRELWDSLRPAMHGVTARSRNRNPDNLRITDQANTELRKGQVLLLLKEQLKQPSADCHSWHHRRSKLYDIREHQADLNLIGLDAVIIKPPHEIRMVKPTLHGIVITDQALDASTVHSLGASVCDYLHIIELTDSPPEKRPKSKTFVGWHYVGKKAEDVFIHKAYLPKAPNSDRNHEATANLVLGLLLL